MVSKRLLIALAATVLGVAACTGGPGDREDLVSALTRDDTFSTPEAECIADAVFAEYGQDEDALGRISGASTFEELNGPDGVPGFAEFFDNTVAACSNT